MTRETTKGLSSIIRQFWGFIVWTFEKADIIPPLIIVSAWHYSGALAKVDPLPVAIALGILIDLGHYRSVKATIANNTWRRFAVMTVLTVMTGYYHWLWYRDLVLSAAVPTLIICLSLLSKWGGWERQALRVEAPQPAQVSAQPKKPARSPLACGRSFASQQAEAGHIRHCLTCQEARKEAR